MNERAKELWSKAVYYNEDTQCWELNRKKFVDSIVSECASIAGKAEYSDTWLEPVEDAIKKHFGVEE